MLRHLRTFTPVIAGIAVFAFGIFFAEVWGLYSTIPHFDKVLHCLGGLVAAWFALALLQSEITHLAAWKQILVLVSIATLVGVVWEWAEYASNFAVTTNPAWYRFFHGGDLTDTVGDLMSDVAGALAFSLWALFKERR